MKRFLASINIPHVFIFLSGIILFSSILTYIVPSGTYERSVKNYNNVQQTVVEQGTYREIPKHYSVKGFLLGDKVDGKANPTSLLGLFSSIPKGMNQAASLIFFIFIIGAVFNVIQHTGTINVIVFNLLKRFRKSPTLLTFLLFAVFSMTSTFLGIGAIFIPLIPVLLMLSKEMGYDRLFGVSIFLIAQGVGWSTAITNPFTVQIAQQIAEVPIGSGIGLRIIMFLTCFSIGFGFLMLYGNRVKKNRLRSVMPDDEFILEDVEIKDMPFTWRHFWISISSIILFALILFAVQTMGWGLIEMSGGFFTVGLLAILISGMSGDESMEAFIKGLQVMIVPALIVGFARGIQVVLQEGQIIDTILYHASNSLQELPALVAAQGMYGFQMFLNFFIPSASGQAMVAMPLMAPLADLLGITRQTAVLAFTSGDGFSNMIIPTNGILMAILGIAQVPYEKWFRFVLPLFIILTIIAAVFLVVAVVIGY